MGGQRKEELPEERKGVSDVVVRVSFLIVDVGSPESQVVPEQLHDGGAVSVLVFLQGVQVLNGRIKRLLSELASDLGVVEDFEVEDGVVEGQAKADGVRGLEFLAYEHSFLVAIVRVVAHLLATGDMRVSG